MKRLMVIPFAALALMLNPLEFQTWADDAHHPGKATKAGKSTSDRAKQKPKKTSAQDAWSGTHTTAALGLTCDPGSSTVEGEGEGGGHNAIDALLPRRWRKGLSR